MSCSDPVIDLSKRAGHPPERMRSLHGSLFDIKCSNDSCGWVQRGNFDDPFCPALAPASEDPPPGETLPLLDPYHRIKHIKEDELPKCPECKVGLQRPGVVWFGESLDQDMLMGVENWLQEDTVVSLNRQYGRKDGADLSRISCLSSEPRQSSPLPPHSSRKHDGGVPRSSTSTPKPRTAPNCKSWGKATLLLLKMRRLVCQDF